jgi:hypothetical protein
MASPASAITVDGSVSDWGITLVNGPSGTTPGTGGSSYAGVAGTPGLLGSTIEDTNDASNSYAVGPNYGGQDYDAQFLGIARAANTLYVAVTSGQRPDNGYDRFEPGDFRMTVLNQAGGTDYYGIEVGGGKGGSAGASPSANSNNWTAGSTTSSGSVTEGMSGTFYTLNSSGFATNWTDDRLAGAIYKNPAFYTDPIPNPTTYSQLQLSSGPGALGTLVGSSDYVFQWASGSVHSTIELSLDLGLILDGPNAQILKVEWQPSCGNDLLWVDLSHDNKLVPEPGAVALAALCAGSLLLRRRARRA